MIISVDLIDVEKFVLFVELAQNKYIFLPKNTLEEYEYFVKLLDEIDYKDSSSLKSLNKIFRKRLPFVSININMGEIYVLGSSIFPLHRDISVYDLFETMLAHESLIIPAKNNDVICRVNKYLGII